MRELAVFDIAGTTVSEGSAVYRALSRCVRERGARIDPPEVERRKGRDKETAIAELLRIGGVDADDDAVAAAFRRFRELLRAAYREDPPVAMPGAPEVLRALRADSVGVALTTGFTRDIAVEVLFAAGLRESREYDVLVTTEDVPAGRPAPYLIHRAMLLTGAADVRRVTSTGDTVADVASARNAGVTAVAVLSGDTPRRALLGAGPDHLLPSVADYHRVRAL